MTTMRTWLFLCSIILLALCAGGITASAQPEKQITTKEQLEQNITGTHTQIADIEKEIQAYKRQVELLRTRSTTLEHELDAIEVEQNKLIADVSLTQKKIDLTNLEISDITRDILEIETVIESNRGAIKKSLRTINEIDGQSFVEKLLGQRRLADYWIDSDTLLAFQSELQNRIKVLRRLRAELDNQRSASLKKSDDLLLLRDEVEHQRGVAEEKQREQLDLVVSTKSQEKEFQRLLKTKEALKKSFEDELFKYESQLSVLIDPTLLPRPGSAPLAWPLKEVLITQRFGKTIDSQRLYTSGSHSGVDFRANGDPVMAMASGTIMGVGDTDLVCRGASFGKWVLIKYDNNLASTYGHLSLVTAKVGQRVSSGDVVAYSGNSGYSTAPHLHVSLYVGVDANGETPVKVEGKESKSCKGEILLQPRAAPAAYLSALDYLPVASRDMYKNKQ
ncbi:MAG: murein DD-endopeptidase MepM/ murein hydrolase activator NlpD [Planctomycetota bacterium]|jgi:murein DD-endopeptidase MepM/ murein hydrolase activator NlpD